MTRDIPYTYECADCGATDTASNARGPLRTRCRACMFGEKRMFRRRHSAADTARYWDRVFGRLPKTLAPTCAGCGAAIEAQKGRGRRRTFCAVCRPAKASHEHAIAAVERFEDERRAWQSENPRALKPSVFQRKGN